MKYLGRIISAEGIQTDPDKTAVIHQWPAPTNLKEIRQFLGFASYYRRFIKNFANVAAPLYKLTEKQTSWEWTSETNQAFHSLKHLLTSAPVLTFPRFDDQFIVDQDGKNKKHKY